MTLNGTSNTNGDGLPEVVDQSPPNGISVLVVGSGIGGLSAARECWRIGCDVRVFERQPHELLTGDTFSIGPSALNSLDNFPRLARDVHAVALDPIFTIRKYNGEIIKGPMEMTDFFSPAARAVAKGNVERHSRPKLYNVMLKHLKRVGVPVEHGKEVVDYFEDAAAGRAGVVLKDGSRHDADLVIAADGLNGHSWKIALGYEVPARPSGDATFRCAYPIEYALKDPVVDAAFPLRDGRAQLNMYMGGEIQLFIGRYHDEMHWGIIHKDDGRAKESWDHHPSVEKAVELLEPFKELPDAIKHVIRATPPGIVVDWRIMWRDPQPKWTSPAGHVIQLGDAAHTFHPSSGNGGTQAFEDAISLAKCLSIAGKENIEWATRVTNLLRFERVSCLQAFGLNNQALRKKGGTVAELGKWIIAHDPEEYAAEKYEEALSHLQKGTPFQNTNTPPGMVYKPWTIDTLLDDKERGEATVLSGDWS